ncbi:MULTISPECIES: S1C family serine protease [Anaerolinea]|uniref:S1C family serine protease n=1 Tax=Anaerolinea TaxID=233189 RepID=UPI00262F25D4|nr:S1C family serine protease [Anaerolinea thermophila]
MKSFRLLAVVVIFGLLLGACTPSAPQTPQETVPPATPKPIEPTATSVPEGLVSSVEDVRKATIQIEAQGTFMDPEFGTLYNVAGRGSGFIIDPSGIAVTNNHVVTGAALLKVFVAGESKPRNAKVLGVSECWDLAVIDIEGDGYPYMEFHKGDVNPGLEVYAAGFPLGDPEYTLTKGIVSKARASGEVSWASVDSVIEHDARIRPGNSGGPLVNAEGKVVGINYAGNDRYDYNFAIKGQDALSVIETLRSGKDFESIGINGQAVVSEDGSISGIWVASVKSGSPADKAGLQPGDILTRMEGLILATDGTYSDYCDILRSHQPEDTLSIEVLRFSTGEVLAGQLNGRALETSFSFANTLEDDVSGQGGSYDQFVTVTDNYSAIQVNIPSAWSEVDGSPWISDGDVIGASITAAANLDAFNNSFDESGVFFGVSDDIAKLGGYIQLLDVYRGSFKSSCEYGGRYDYKDSAYEGAYDVFKKCNGSQNVLVVLSARPQQYKTSMLITVMVNMTNDQDAAAFDEILRTFDVIGPLP